MGDIPLFPIKYMPNTGKHRYLVEKKTFNLLKQYQELLANNNENPGINLRASINYFLAELRNEKTYDPKKELSLEDREILKKIPPEAFFQLLMNSREPIIDAEFQKIGANEIWNEFEYDILGRLCSYVEGVDVYDNGRWGPKEGVGDARYVAKPHSISLLCVPGAILRKNSRDSETLVEEDGINEAKYKALYKEKLLTAFYQANESAKQKGNRAFITTPVIGEGASAGNFKGKTAKYFYNTLAELLEEHPEWNNIACVWIDGYQSNLCKDETIQSTLLRIRNTGNENQNEKHALFSESPYGDLGQLSKASEYAESAEEEAQFSQYARFKIFAWDHFSFEGNDWLAGVRTTDEANMASCNALSILFGEEGEYRQYPNKEEYAYFPPKGFDSWWDCFMQQKDEVKQSIEDRLYVLENGELTLRPDPKQALKELKQDINSPTEKPEQPDESKSEKPEQTDESKPEKPEQTDESKSEKTKQTDESKPEKPEQTDESKSEESEQLDESKSEKSKQPDEPKNSEQSNKSQSENSKKPDQKAILANIVGTLIKNIETKSGKRFTSGINSKKVQRLKDIQTRINSEDEIKTGSKKLKEYTQNIMKICKIKRNPIHFWRSPDSVKEYVVLLKENNIKFTPKTKTPKPKPE
jgi:hypothetical protein